MMHTVGGWGVILFVSFWSTANESRYVARPLVYLRFAKRSANDVFVGVEKKWAREVYFQVRCHVHLVKQQYTKFLLKIVFYDIKSKSINSISLYCKHRFCFKDWLPGVRQFLATASPLKMMKNAFHFT